MGDQSALVLLNEASRRKTQGQGAFPTVLVYIRIPLPLYLSLEPYEFDARIVEHPQRTSCVQSLPDGLVGAGVRKLVFPEGKVKNVGVRQCRHPPEPGVGSNSSGCQKWARSAHLLINRVRVAKVNGPHLASSPESLYNFLPRPLNIRVDAGY